MTRNGQPPNRPPTRPQAAPLPRPLRLEQPGHIGDIADPARPVLGLKDDHGPHETGWHRHGMAYVVVPVHDGSLLLELPGGETATAQLTAGVAYARGAGMEHNVVNAGDAPLSFVETELKHLIG